jgi:hypothetical protein
MLRARELARRSAGCALLTVPLVLAAGGCGSKNKIPQGLGGHTVGANVERIGPPPMKETIQQAAARIHRLIKSGDCGAINKLLPLSHTAGATTGRCHVTEQLASSSPVLVRSYKGLAGVIDYPRGAGFTTAVLVRDSDGLYHVAFFQSGERHTAANTDFDPQFTPAVGRALAAIRARDCTRFLKLSFHAFGPESGDLKADCARLQHENNTFAATLSDDPFAKPKLIGGNAYFAFYGIRSAFGYYTVVMILQPRTPTAAGVATHAYFDNYLVNESG